MHIDIPANQHIIDVVTPVNGWLAIPLEQAATCTPELLIDGEKFTVRASFYSRPDLDPAQACGFTVYLDLRPLPTCPTLDLVMRSSDYGASTLTLSIGAQAWAQRDAGAWWNVEKRTRIPSILNRAFATNLAASAGQLPLNALPPEWPVDPRIEHKKDPVSSHYYGPEIQQFLAGLPPQSIVLDVGAGLRRIPWPNVINCEIYDYPSTDILCVGSQLPIRDNSVDGVLSLAVLEHVPNPFACSAEIERVLKPGGKAFVMIPFLQAEHGYPHHYFNATRQGVRELFSGLRCLDQYLDTSNHPILTCNQILQIYLQTLAVEQREKWLSLSVREIISLAAELSKESILTNPLLPVTEESWHIAWGTTTIFEK